MNRKTTEDIEQDDLPNDVFGAGEVTSTPTIASKKKPKTIETVKATPPTPPTPKTEETEETEAEPETEEIISIQARDLESTNIALSEEVDLETIEDDDTMVMSLVDSINGMAELFQVFTTMVDYMDTQIYERAKKLGEINAAIKPDNND